MNYKHFEQALTLSPHQKKKEVQTERMENEKGDEKRKKEGVQSTNISHFLERDF